jgi:hypothetical protein
MSNVDDILKQILLNMNYDSSKTLLENRKIITEACIPLSEPLNDFVKGKNRSDKYPELGKWEDGTCRCEEDTKCLKFKKNCCKTVGKPVANIKSSQEDEETIFVSYQSVVPQQIITVPMLKYGFHVSEWHETNETYVEGEWDTIFGKPCKRLAGLDETFTLGENPEKNYFVKENGERCPTSTSTIKYWIVYNNVRDNKYSYRQKWEYKNGKDSEPTLVGYYYKEKGKPDVASNWIEAKGKTLEAIKTKVEFIWARGFELMQFPEDCKPLDYEVCMRWSHRALLLSGVEGGAKTFSTQDPITKEQKKYTACIQVGGEGDKQGVHWPWYSRYYNFYDMSQIEVKMVDGKEERFCHGLQDIIQIPDFKIGNNPVGSKNESQIEDLENKKEDAVDGYKEQNVRASIMKNVNTRLGNELEMYKMGAIVMGK